MYHFKANVQTVVTCVCFFIWVELDDGVDDLCNKFTEKINHPHSFR